MNEVKASFLDGSDIEEMLAPDANPAVFSPVFTSEPISIPTGTDLEDYKRIRAHDDGILQLAPDIFAWLTSLGPNWEAKADAILRREMLLERSI